jgi:hypothetical protein
MDYDGRILAQWARNLRDQGLPYGGNSYRLIVVALIPPGRFTSESAKSMRAMLGGLEASGILASACLSQLGTCSCCSAAELGT